MRIHSETAWNIASQFSNLLASDTRTLAAMIDDALDAKVKAAVAIAERNGNAGIGSQIATLQRVMPEKDKREPE